VGAAGGRRALYPVAASRAASTGALRVYRVLRDEGTQGSVLDEMQTREELYEVLGYHDYERKLDELFTRRD
jgi:methylisocitrate lyase